MAQLNMSKKIQKTATALSWLQHTFSFPATEDAQRPDSDHIRETDNGDHIHLVIQLCIEIALFC